MVFRTCNELDLCVYLNRFDIGLVSFAIAIVGFYLVVVDIGYCFVFAIVMLLLIRNGVSNV